MLCFFITSPLSNSVFVNIHARKSTARQIIFQQLYRKAKILLPYQQSAPMSTLFCYIKEKFFSCSKAKRKKISRWGNWRNCFHGQMQEDPKLFLLINAAQHRLYNPAFGVAGAGAGGKRQNWRAMFRNNPGFNDRLFQTGC